MTSLLSSLFSFLPPSLSLSVLISSLSSLRLRSPSSLQPNLSPLWLCSLFQSLLSFYVLYLHTLLPTLWGPTVPLNFTSPSLLVYALPLFLFLSLLVFFPLAHTQFNFHFLCRSLLSAFFQRSGERLFVAASEAIGACMTPSYQKNPRASDENEAESKEIREPTASKAKAAMLESNRVEAER